MYKNKYLYNYKTTCSILKIILSVFFRALKKNSVIPH